MLIQLPNGLIDGSDHFNYVEVDELRGKQQNYLANQDLVVGNIGHIPKILEDMVLSIQTKEGLTWKGDISKAIWKLPSGDLETILIKVRENTYGHKFFHGAVCDHCEHEMKDLLLNLSDLEVTSLPLADIMQPKIIALPKTKIVVEVKPTQLKDLFDMIKITTTNKDKLITSLIPLSIKSMRVEKDGAEVLIDKVKSEHIENLPVSDLMFLQDELEKLTIEGSIDTMVDIECSNCHKDYSIKLNVFDSSFFDPTKGSTSGNM